MLPHAAAHALICLATAMFPLRADADSSSATLASYYNRHMAVVDGVAYGWDGQAQPRRMRAGVSQVGVGRDAYYVLLDNGELLRWSDQSTPATRLAHGVTGFAAGHSGWFAIDRAGGLWHGRGNNATAVRVADRVVAASIGDGADYYVTAEGALHVAGLAHRGQYGDGQLTETPGFFATARDVVAVKAHTGHAIHLRRDGVVLGTGGNRFGPLSRHGLGDKADRWGPIFSGAVAIATGSRHSVAIRADASLWAWGEGFAVEPTKLLEQVVAVAAGDSATIARSTDGALWQWDGGGVPRRLQLVAAP